MEFVEINKDNIDSEHLGCALSDKVAQSAKKDWLRPCLAEGYKFIRLVGNGKVFIEYVPAENAWAPIDASGYMFIDCFWVSGKSAKSGIGTALLDRAIGDAKAQGKKGMVAVSAEKKLPFLSDPKFYKKKGFTVADTAPPYYELLYLPFGAAENMPAFRASAKKSLIDEKGVVLLYTNHCPWNSKYVPKLESVAKKMNAPFKAVEFKTKEEAQNAPNPFTTYALFYDGEFVTNEIFSEKKLENFLIEKGF